MVAEHCFGQTVIHKPQRRKEKPINCEIYADVMEGLLKGENIETTIPKETQLVPSARRFTWSFYCGSEVLPGDSRHGGNRPSP